ncbi:hypothetical protein Bca4012_026621 [Brassica carinata]
MSIPSGSERFRFRFRFGSTKRMITNDSMLQILKRARAVTRRTSTELDSPASSPPRRRSGEGVGGGVGDKEVAEPYSVYTARRKAASGRKRSNDAASYSSTAVSNLRLDTISSTRFLRYGRNLKVETIASVLHVPRTVQIKLLLSCRVFSMINLLLLLKLAGLP